MSHYKDKVTKGPVDVVRPEGWEANARLFAETLTVFHETNLTPRELAQALTLLRKAESLYTNRGLIAGYPDVGPWINATRDLLAKAKL